MKYDTTQKIIESAANRFFLEGFCSVSMDSIAETANVTKVTVYQHFSSKEELFLECLRWRLRSRETQLDAWCAAMPGSAAGILEIFDWMANKATRGHFHGCAFLKATSEMAFRLPQVRAIALESKNLLRRRIIAMLRESGLQDANALGHTFELLLEGAQALSVIEQNQRPFKAAKCAAQNHLDRYSSSSSDLPDSSHVEN